MNTGEIDTVREKPCGDIIYRLSIPALKVRYIIIKRKRIEAQTRPSDLKATSQA